MSFRDMIATLTDKLEAEIRTARANCEDLRGRSFSLACFDNQGNGRIGRITLTIDPPSVVMGDIESAEEMLEAFSAVQEPDSLGG